MNNARAIVIGASHAGAQLCASLRQEGWTGDIVLIGDEPVLPYHRPPLSKTFLSGQASLDDLLIRTPDFYEKQRISVRHARVTNIDRGARQIWLDDGEVLAYDKLALCLGARARLLPLPGADLPGVHVLRDAADILAIRARLPDTRRVVIVGAGYIGLEAAASLRALGLEVTVLESAERALNRVTAPVMSAFYTRIHREHGVDLRTGVQIVGFEGDDCPDGAQLRGVRLGDGEFIAAELAIVGIGVEPNTALAEAAGLAIDNGIIINAQTLTSDPDIVAAGDCARYVCIQTGRSLRLESVPNAGEQAKVAAATLCGKPKTISALPWFWSDQYDIKLQIAGLNTGYDDLMVHGDPDIGRSFSVFYFRAGKLLAADCINRPQDFMRCRKLLADGQSTTRSQLSDLVAG